jgi:SAM-dependent methyltransferase
MTSDSGRALRACGLCGATDFRKWWSVNGFDIGACGPCGLVQVLQDVPDEELTALYARGYYEGESDKAYRDYLSDPETKGKHFGEQLDALTREYSLRPGALLEIGCAFGLFLDQARRRGWQVRGTERSQFSGEWARTHLHLDVDTSPDALTKVPSGSQDVVVLWDVVEHLRYPLDTVREARRVLRPGGLLALTTGDVKSLGARIYGRRWFLVAPPHHLFYLGDPDPQCWRSSTRVGGTWPVDIELDRKARPLRRLALQERADHRRRGESDLMRRRVRRRTL